MWEVFEIVVSVNTKDKSVFLLVLVHFNINKVCNWKV